MNEAHAPLAEADLTQVQGLTLEDLTRMHGGDSPQAPSEEAFAPNSASGTEEPEEPHWMENENQNLQQALHLELEQDSFQLDQRDDLQALAERANALFQHKLPETMERLSKSLHAQEQISHLYTRLSELSEQRGAAATIIQTARQIENLEQLLQKEQVDSEKIQTVQNEIEVFQQILQQYTQVFQLLQAKNQAQA